jgi:hypothetical protein
MAGKHMRTSLLAPTARTVVRAAQLDKRNSWHRATLRVLGRQERRRGVQERHMKLELSVVLVQREHARSRDNIKPMVR